VNSGQFCFQGKRKLLKNPECKSILNTVKNSRAIASCSKILNVKVNSIQWIFSGQTLYFTVIASYSKILNGEKYSQYSEKFQGKLCCLGQAQVTQKSWIMKNVSIQWKISGHLCFSGQAQVAQKSWMIKNIYSIQWIQDNSVFRSSASCSEIPNNEKDIQNSEQFQRTRCFSGQSQVAQKSWMGKKIFNTVKNFTANSVYQGTVKKFSM